MCLWNVLKTQLLTYTTDQALYKAGDGSSAEKFYFWSCYNYDKLSNTEQLKLKFTN